MFDNYIVEIRPKSAGITVQAGIVVRDGQRFRFFAATHAFESLEGQLFKSPQAAESAVHRYFVDRTRDRLADALAQKRASGAARRRRIPQDF